MDSLDTLMLYLPCKSAANNAMELASPSKVVTTLFEMVSNSRKHSGPNYASENSAERLTRAQPRARTAFPPPTICTYKISNFNFKKLGKLEQEKFGRITWKKSKLANHVKKSKGKSLLQAKKDLPQNWKNLQDNYVQGKDDLWDTRVYEGQLCR